MGHVHAAQNMKISILIPCHNEEKCVRTTVRACLEQTRQADQIVVVDDASTDRSVQILEEFGDAIQLVKLPVNTGNKSFVQQHGLQFLTGDVFVATDADSRLDNRFLERIEKDFMNPETVAVAGYVRSMKYNWITALREIEYLYGQEIHKTAQSNLGFLFVVPGCAAAFRTRFFKESIRFDHDTITEDLDFSYQINKRSLKILFDKQAIVYTQDPSDIRSYVAQMRRWYGGGWQNLAKHFSVVNRSVPAFELSLMYFEGTIFSFIFFALPFVNLRAFGVIMAAYFAIFAVLGAVAAATRKRIDLLLFSPLFFVPMAVNSYVFLEQLFLVIVLGRKNFVWVSPSRKRIA